MFSIPNPFFRSFTHYTVPTLCVAQSAPERPYLLRGSLPSLECRVRIISTFRHFHESDPPHIQSLSGSEGRSQLCTPPASTETQFKDCHAASFTTLCNDKQVSGKRWLILRCPRRGREEQYQSPVCGCHGLEERNGRRAEGAADYVERGQGEDCEFPAEEE